MKFIRDNIVKILLVVGILIVLIIVLIACSGSGSGGNGSNYSYSRMEDNFKKAAIKQLSNNRDLLPTEEGKIVKVQMDSIYTKKQMDKLTAVDDKSVKCDGYVNVSFRVDETDNKVFRVVPYIKCGDKYETEDLYVHILKNEEIVTELDGLYKIGDDYIYRGENPNNYIQIGNTLYRILSIDNEGYIKIIITKKPYIYSTWDNRYNIDTDSTGSYDGSYDGINDYYVSRIRTSINDLYDSDYFSSDEKDVFVKYKTCIGKRSEGNTLINKTEECSQTIDEDYVSLPLLYDFLIASTDPNCKTIHDESCNNYNYLGSLSNAYTPTGSKEKSNMVYQYYGTAGLVKCNVNKKIVYTLYVANVSYASGKGTAEEPYLIK